MAPARRSSTSILFMAAALTLAGCSSVDQAAVTTGDPIDSSTLKILNENSRQIAAALGLENPPDVQPVRLVKPNEWAAAQIDCLNAAGYDASYTSDLEGVSYPSFSESAMAESLNFAIYTCESQYPVSPKYNLPLSSDQLAFLYQYRATELTECLSRAGYSPDIGAPSEAVFIETDGAWDPYGSTTIAQEDLRLVREKCPVNPDYDELYAQ
ncbi:hypothetical protein [Microbacterium sp. K24]|uniref:hypothetical protein n=1 Tax=Microbacterium sp. K24 TaxID=2305446 RepID=UPI00109BFAEB|nr:hypothetical protein [Microbacterium sp. K24]